MKTIVEILEQRVTQAMQKVTGLDNCSGQLRSSADPRFGDYQSNGVMAIAKQMKKNPRDLAADIVAALDVDDISEKPEIAGPGFINFRLKEDFLATRLMQTAKDDSGRLAIDATDSPQTIVVDFSAPNIAKQMHVGHLRSTIIGDCISRMLDFQGHKVIRQNHIGDWGTQFGMLIAYMKYNITNVSVKGDHAIITNVIDLTDLEDFYKKAKAKFDSDAEFEALSREEVVKLHNHDEETLKDWMMIVDISRNHYQPLYNELAVDLHKDNERGESFYADRLAGIVDELKEKNVATESDGAMCIFPKGFKNKDGDPLPFIVRKSDGAFLYATTDMAALKYRATELGADKIIYVTDARQKLHFEMLFASAALAGWTANCKPVHVWFGTMLGEDNKPFKTRSGETVKLRDLLAESIERATAVVEQKNPGLDDDSKAKIARAVGIGGVKYADFSNNRTTDFVFSFDKMLAMDGNTAPYMQYAYARVKSIERKAADKGIDVTAELSAIETLSLTEQAELDLAKHLARYGEAIAAAAADCRPNYLTSYLYDLAQKFSSFYNACPVLIAGEDKRPTRLMLCDLTARTIKHGLSELLGIDVVEQM